MSKYNLKNGDLRLLNYVDGPTAIECDENILTTNLGIIYRYPDILIRPNYIYVDENNNPGFGKELEDAGYGQPLKVFGQPYEVESGFCSYPVYELNIKAILNDHPEAKADFMKSLVEQYVPSFTRMRYEMMANDPWAEPDEKVTAAEAGMPTIGYINALGAFDEAEVQKMAAKASEFFKEFDEQATSENETSESVEDETSDMADFDKDFVTDADIEDGFTESDGARMERESMIPTEIDDFIEDEEEEADSEYNDYGDGYCE